MLVSQSEFMLFQRAAFIHTRNIS